MMPLIAAAPRPLTAAVPPPTTPTKPSWLAAQGRLPLAFMGLALGWLVFATGALVAAPELLMLPHLAPPLVALVHAWVLGVFVTVAVGACYQLAPVALGTTLWSERSGWSHLLLHSLGVPLTVVSFWFGRPSGLMLGGSLVAIGVLGFAANLWRTVHQSRKRDAVAWSLVLAAGWLAVTVIAGLTVAANRSHPFLSLDPLALLRAHAHLGLVGFFLTLLQGVTFRLIPMFTLGDVPDWRPVRAGLWLSQAGLLILAPALAWHAGYPAAFGAALIVSGLVSSAAALKQTLATRKKRTLDPGVIEFLRGGFGLALTGAAGVWLVLPQTRGSSAPGGFSANVYGVMLIFLGLLPVITGMMCKIVPFLTWMRAYGPKIGRIHTPSATTLSSTLLVRGAFGLNTVAVIPLAVGAWRLSEPLLQFGTGVLALGSACFLTDMLRVLRHLRWPEASAPISRRKTFSS